MSNGNQSFFERLTGTVNLDEQNQPQQPQQPADEFDDQFADHGYRQNREADTRWEEDQEDAVGQLAADMYETPEHIIIQTMVAGVRPDNLDVSIARDRCTISGHRKSPHDIHPDDYYFQELYWGSFSRSVELPEEIEVDAAEASESHGLLTITLPKIKKDRETTLDIHSGN
jgi:HSP20 family protein